MSYTDPNDWERPRTTDGNPPSVPTHGNDGEGTGVDWSPANGVSDVDLKRIETNILGLHTLLCQSGTVAVEINTPYFSAKIEATLKWTRINNIVYLAFPEMESPANVNDKELQIDPATVWPDEILPTSSTTAQAMFTKDQNDDISGRPGYMVIPSVAANAIVCFITNYNVATDEDGCYCDGTEFGVTGFSATDGAGINKAIPEQTVFWMTDRPAAAAPAPTTSTTTGAP